MVKKRKESITKSTLRNSGFKFFTTIFARIMGLVFTVVVARLLMPELFGIYTLALSIATISKVFTDLGINSAILRFVSEALGKNNSKKARSYFRYLIKIKMVLILIVIIIVLLIAKPLAYDVFKKPLVFWPIVFSCLYMMMFSFRTFFENLFYTLKDLRKLPIFEVVSQFSRLILALIALLLLNYDFRVSGIFVALSIAALFSIITILIIMGKNRNLIFGKTIQIEKPRLLRYVAYMGIAGVSFVFFGSIDTLMLGGFVGASYVGYYRAAIGLALPIITILSFSGVFLPVFTQLNKQKLKRAFQKTFKYLVMLVIPASFGLIFVARSLILTIYGVEYSLSILPVYILALLVIIDPINALYLNIFSAKEKPKLIAKFVVVSLLLNIILNYFFITYLLNFSQEYAIFGAGLATVISRAFFLVILSTKAKSKFNIKSKEIHTLKAFFAAIVMVAVLFLFNFYFNVGILLGIIEVLIGIVIYFAVLLAIGGIGKDEIGFIKLFKDR